MKFFAFVKTTKFWFWFPFASYVPSFWDWVINPNTTSAEGKKRAKFLGFNIVVSVMIILVGAAYLIIKYT